MTVTTTLDREYFPGDGSNLNFPFNFRFFSNDQIFVYLIAANGTITPQTITTNYTLTGANSAGGGIVVMLVPPPLTSTLFVQRVLPLDQPTSIRNQGAFFPEIHENVFDRLTMLIQQLFGRIGRVLEFPASDPSTISTILPQNTARANKVLAFDALGDPQVSNLTLDQLEQQPTNAAASAAAAAASAVASAGSATASDSSATASAASAVASGNSAALAQQWAENPEDSPVLPGLFSAHHWANKAAATNLTAQKQLQTIDGTVSGNALTLNWARTPVSFRSTPLTSGAINTRNPGANLSLVVPSGATLGSSNATLVRLVLLLIDNAGSVELAVANLAGGNNLDETTLINTMAISAGATSANTIYSASARTGVPFRVAGFLDLVEPVAGVWSVAPQLKQGAGGQALAAMASFGFGQTRQNVTGSRVAGTNYTNTTGKPIQVIIEATSTTTGYTISFTVGGITYGSVLTSGGAAYKTVISHVILPGETYSVTVVNATLVWTEIR